MKSSIAISAALACALSIAGTAGAMSLDKQGTAETWNCPADRVTLTSHTFRPDRRSYVFSGTCYVGGELSIGNETYNVNAVWDDRQGTAKENITFPGGRAEVNVSARCPDDPWLTNAVCTPVSFTDGARHAFGTGQLPLSRGAIKPGQVQTLKTDAEMAARSAPPTIKLPARDQEFSGEVVFQAQVYVPRNVGNPEGWQVEVQFDKIVWPGTPGAETVKHTVPIRTGYALKKIALAAGSWSVKARNLVVLPGIGWTQNGNWSTAVLFKVEAQTTRGLRIPRRKIQPATPGGLQ